MYLEKEKLVALVTAAQSGDNDALGELFTAFRDTFYYHALKNLDGNEDLALDVLQESFIEIFNTIGKLEAPAAFVSWAKTIVYHQCTRYFKKKTDMTAYEDEEGNTIFDNVEEQKTEFIPDEALDKDDFKATILSFISSLPEEQRAAVMMYYFDEIPVAEIAELQGLSTGTVKSRLNYARKGIKQQVEEYEKKNGIKLHSISILPLIKWVFDGAFSGGISEASAAALAEGVSAATGVTVTATTSAAATSAAATTAAATTATLGAKLAATPLGVKIISGILAASIVVGGSAAVIFGGDKDKDNPSSNPSASEPSGDLNGYGGPSFDDHTHEWGEAYVYETKKFGVIDIEYKEKACKICGLIEPAERDMWMLAANVLGDEYYAFLDRYFEVAGPTDSAFDLAGLFAAGDFLATEPYHDQESVEVSAKEYYENLLQYFDIPKDILDQMKQQRPGDTYTLSFVYNGGGLIETSCIWLGGNRYRVYYTTGASSHDYWPPFYVDIQYNLHNGQPNKIIEIGTDGKAFYDPARANDYSYSVEVLLEDIFALKDASSYDFEINCLSVEDASYIEKFLGATDIFGYDLTADEYFGKLWGRVKPEFEGGSLKKTTTSFYLPIDYMTDWEADVNAIRTQMARRDMDKFIKLVGSDNYKLLYNDGEKTEEIGLKALTDDMIKSVVSGWEGVGSIRLESLAPIEAKGKNVTFAFTVTPADGLIQSAYVADFEITFS